MSGERKEVGTVLLREVGEDELILRNQIASGEIGSGKKKEKLNVTTAMNGSLMIEFKKGGKFVVEVRDVIDVAYNVILERRHKAAKKKKKK